ncbi:MAG: hypothetical protein ACRD4P_10915 [Bryobacteraceae bacterium]
MSCSTYDWKGFVLGELNAEGRQLAAEHVKTCVDCREEVDRLRLTQAALFALREEEIPRRIAFVSDPVLKPHWWRRLWMSGPAMGFASAVLLACAILVHGAYRPASTPVQPGMTSAEIARRVDAEVDKRVKTAVVEAVSEVEARDGQKTAELVKAVDEKYEFQRRADLAAFEDYARMQQKKTNLAYMAMTGIDQPSPKP